MPVIPAPEVHTPLGDGEMTAVLQGIRRYAVKGLSDEVLADVCLVPGHGIAGDRQYALALPNTVFDPAHPTPLPKTKFAVLVRYARLAQLSTTFVSDTSTLVLRRRDRPCVSGRLDTQEGRAMIEAAIADLLEGEINGALRIVAADGHRFTDVSVVSPAMMEAVSMINLASVRALGDKIGREIDPRRFRGNFVVDGLRPWQEFELVGKQLRIGEVTFEGLARTKRCAATEVNPDSAERDMRVPAEILKNFGHPDMGIYLGVVSGGTVRMGDRVELPA